MLTIPNFTISVTTSEAVVSGRLITAAGGYPDAVSDNVVGVSLVDTDSGKSCPVMVQGVAEVDYTSTAPSKGDTLVVSATDGKVAKSTTPSTVTVGNAIGIALAAGANGKVLALINSSPYVGVATED